MLLVQAAHHARRGAAGATTRVDEGRGEGQGLGFKGQDGQGRGLGRC